MTPAKTSCSHDFRSRTNLAFGAAAGLPRPAWGLAGRCANPEYRQFSDRAGSTSRRPLHPWRQGVPDQHSGIDPAHGDRLRRCDYDVYPARIDDGPEPGRGIVLQSAADGDLSGAEGGADADHHALARRRRSCKNTGYLSRRQPPRDLSQLSGRKSGRGKDAVVGRCHGAVGNAADDSDRTAGGGAGNILFNSLDMGQYDTVYAMIIIIGAMGIGLDAAFEKLRGRLVRWSEPGFDIPLSFA